MTIVAKLIASANVVRSTAEGRPDAGDCGDRGERAQPPRARQRRPDVQTADVIDLRDHPAQLQPPATRAPAGRGEDRVEDVLLAHQNRNRKVHDDQVRETRERAPVGDVPVPAREMTCEQPNVDQNNERDEPVVMHQPRMLERTTHRRRHTSLRSRTVIVGESIGNMPGERIHSDPTPVRLRPAIWCRIANLERHRSFLSATVVHVVSWYGTAAPVGSPATTNVTPPRERAQSGLAQRALSARLAGPTVPLPTGLGTRRGCAVL